MHGKTLTNPEFVVWLCTIIQYLHLFKSNNFARKQLQLMYYLTAIISNSKYLQYNAIMSYQISSLRKYALM
jgi:hypothetical protein